MKKFTYENIIQFMTENMDYSILCGDKNIFVGEVIEELVVQNNMLHKQNDRLLKLAFANLLSPDWCIHCPCRTSPASCKRRAHTTCEETLLQWAKGEYDE